jgi:tripartite-type tricarboxylate transporter receptor subunit TctC
MFRRTLLAATLCAALPLAAHAQARSTRIVVSFTPGGPVDFVARVLAEALGKELGQTVVVENKPGANGAIGAAEVLRSKPDGSTLWIASVGAAAINTSLYEKLPYNTARDFAPVSLVANNVELLVVNPADPARDAAEFVANTKRVKAPTAIASSGIGSIPHLAMEQLKDASGANLLHVPYKGAAPAITDVMGGQVAAFFGDVPGLITYARGGKLKPIGIAAAKRHPALPDVKTLAEQGIPNVDTNNWYALFAPAATPPARVGALNEAVRRALSQPGVKARLLEAGTEAAPSTPAELASLLKRDTDKWARMIQDKKIRAE